MNTLQQSSAVQISGLLIVNNDDAMLLPKHWGWLDMQEEVKLTVGIVSIPENRIWKIVCWLPKKITGTHKLQDQLSILRNDVSVIKDIVHVLVAEISANWSPEKRERVQRYMTNFSVLQKALDDLQPEGNPFTVDEVRRLRFYTEKAQSGEPFQVDEAQDYRQLSERAAHEYPGQDWVKELLKVAIFIFALYAFSKILEPEK